MHSGPPEIKMNTMKVRLQYKVEVMVYQEIDLDESEIKELNSYSRISPSDPLYSRLTSNVNAGMIEWWGDIENVSVFKV
jgi:hypothetical protein